MAAFTISSDTLNTRSDSKSLFNFLSNFENFKQILPDDKISNFDYSGGQCSFTINGVTTMTVKIADKHAYEYILFSSEGLAKFNFNLKVSFAQVAGLAQCQIELQADLNPFVKAMAEKPLTALVNTMAQKLAQLNPQHICK